MPDFAIVYRARRWADLKEFLRLETQGWLFRGHREADWPLKSALERAEVEDKPRHERELVDAFRRRAAVHIAPQILPVDTFGWMGLMQHYGAPTRLLDWTRSPYVAAFFAIEEASRPGEVMGLWAVHAVVLQQASVRALQRLGVGEEEAHRLVYHRQNQLVTDLVEQNLAVDAVFPVEPWQFDFRQSVQQSIFLCPGNVTRSFRENLAALKALCDPDWPMPAVVKVEIAPEVRHEALEDLRLMNVTAASLFPGLDGFARSLRTAFVRSPDPPIMRALRSVKLEKLPGNPLGE